MYTYPSNEAFMYTYELRIPVYLFYAFHVSSAILSHEHNIQA